MKSFRIIYRKHGNPLEVLEVEEFSLAPLTAGQARVRMLYSPIHPSDLGRIQGSYGKLEELPVVGGREGVGEVVEISGKSNSIKVGDMVLWPQDSGSWQEYGTFAADQLYRLPEGFPFEAAALFQINPPTAWCLLDLQQELGLSSYPLIQNAANSSVGVLIGQMAAERGIRCYNMVRSGPSIAAMESLGWEVWPDGEEGLAKILDLPAPHFGINSVGGESVMRLLKAMRDGGDLVTIGGMVRDKVRFPTRELIFHAVALRGFWLDEWYRKNPEAKKQLWKDLTDWVVRSKPQFPVAGCFSLEEFPTALAMAGESRWGKVLFDGV